MAQYDKFADKYIKIRDEGFNPNRNIEMPHMFKMVGNLEGKKLLDLGCGFGVHAEFYSKNGAMVTGIDASENEIEYAKNKKIKNAEFFVFDITKKLSFDAESFEIIACSLVLDHIEDLGKFFRECFRVLKREGIMILSIPNPVFYQEESIAGIINDGGIVKIYGDYFNRRKIVHKWMKGEMVVEAFHRPLEDYFSAFLHEGFILKEFSEARPEGFSDEWSDFDKKGFEFTSRNPYYLFFKLAKEKV